MDEDVYNPIKLVLVMLLYSIGFAGVCWGICFIVHKIVG